jgi:hypothetical protein
MLNTILSRKLGLVFSVSWVRFLVEKIDIILLQTGSQAFGLPSLQLNVYCGSTPGVNSNDRGMILAIYIYSLTRATIFPLCPIYLGKDNFTC